MLNPTYELPFTTYRYRQFKAQTHLSLKQENLLDAEDN